MTLLKDEHIAYSIISLAISMIDDRTNTKQQMKLHILASSGLLACCLDSLPEHGSGDSPVRGISEEDGRRPSR